MIRDDILDANCFVSLYIISKPKTEDTVSYFRYRCLSTHASYQSTDHSRGRAFKNQHNTKSSAMLACKYIITPAGTPPEKQEDTRRMRMGHQRTRKDEAGLRARMTTGRKAQDRIGENLGRVEDEGVRRKKGGDT